MAMNPMQRRARNSFLIGFLVSLLIMAVVVLLLLNKIKTINEAKEALEALQIQVYVAADDLESGQAITLEEHFITDTVQTKMDPSEILSSEDFEFVDEEGNYVEKFNSDGSQKYKELVMKVDVPSGSIVTKDMVIESGEETTDTQRIQEYNMIILPSQLKNGDYIDIRLTLPSGQDYIVLSKKKVLGTSNTGLWLKLDEEEILTINNAIVEAYALPGSKLYAIQYVEAGIQEKSIPTYTVSAAVLNLINSNPNITEKAKGELWNRYNPETRVNFFESALDPYREEHDSLVESGFSEEVESVKAAREQFVESLEGTEDIGYSR